MLARPVPSRPRTKRQGIKAKATTERKTLIFNHIPSGFFIMLTQPKNAKSQAIQYQRSQSPNKFSLLLFRITLEKHQAFQKKHSFLVSGRPEDTKFHHNCALPSGW